MFADYKVSIKSVSPLLQKNAGMMLAPQKGKTKGEELGPADQAAQSVYLGAEGEFVHPTIAFKSAFLSAAKEFKGGPFGRSNAGKYLAGALNLMPQPSAQLLDYDGNPLTEYDVHVATVVNPSTRGRIVRGWPKWNEWRVDLDVSVANKFWPGDEDSLLEIFNVAGRLYGVGDGRPEKRKLSFGMFSAEWV